MTVLLVIVVWTFVSVGLGIVIGTAIKAPAEPKRHLHVVDPERQRRAVGKLEHQPKRHSVREAHRG